MYILTGLIVLLCAAGLVTLIFSVKESPHQNGDNKKCPYCGLINPKNSLRCDCGKSHILSPDTPRVSSNPCNLLSKAVPTKKLSKAGFALPSNEKIIANAGIKKELEAEVAAAIQTIPSLGSTNTDKNIIRTEGLGAALENSRRPFSKTDKEALDLIRQAVLDNYLTNRFQGKGGIIKYLEESLHMSPHQALLIARDQSGKIHGIVTMIRAQKSGSIGYEWNNSKDQRVRGNPSGKYPDVPKAKNHWTREGEFFLWERMDYPPIAPDGKPFRQPPSDGHPGHATLCRCFASPIF